VRRKRHARLVEEGVIEFVTADLVLGGSINGLHRTGLVVAHDVGHGLDPAGANHAEEPTRIFGKQRAMLPPATTSVPARRKKNDSCHIRSKSICSPVRNTMAYSPRRMDALSNGPLHIS
jgi:hypothetical protein